MGESLLDPQYGWTRDGYSPSPDEIRRRCAEIQAGWSPREERGRRSWSVDREAVELATAADVELVEA